MSFHMGKTDDYVKEHNKLTFYMCFVYIYDAIQEVFYGKLKINNNTQEIMLNVQQCLIMMNVSLLFFLRVLRDHKV